MKHTSGPWHVAPLSPTWVGTKYGEQVASIDTFEIEDKEEQEANALLIAAAPDLLEALRLIASAKTRGFDIDYVTGCANAAVAKATGREP